MLALRSFKRLIAASLLAGFIVAGSAGATDEAATGEWLPACSSPIVIAAVYKHEHRIHVMGYVKNGLIGRTLKLQSALGGGSTVQRFKAQPNGFFHINPRRPHHRHAPRAAWRIALDDFHTPWVKLQRQFVLNNVHQQHGLLMINGEIRLKARSDTMITVQRLDDCHTAVSLGQLAMPTSPSTTIDGAIQLRDLSAPTATFVRLRVRVREKRTGAWGRTHWTLALPIVLRP